MRLSRLTVVLLCVLTAAACGSSNPNAPSHTSNYAGTWTGNYTISGCTQSGAIALANACASTGGSAPFAFTLAQSNLSVTGSFTLGTVTFSSTGGTIAADNSLALSGMNRNGTSTINATWHLTNPGAQIGGTVTWVLTDDNLSGNATIVGTIATAIHSGS